MAGIRASPGSGQGSPGGLQQAGYSLFPFPLATKGSVAGTMNILKSSDRRGSVAKMTTIFNPSVIIEDEPAESPTVPYYRPLSAARSRANSVQAQRPVSAESGNYSLNSGNRSETSLHLDTPEPPPIRERSTERRHKRTVQTVQTIPIRTSSQPRLDKDDSPEKRRPAEQSSQPKHERYGPSETRVAVQQTISQHKNSKFNRSKTPIQERQEQPMSNQPKQERPSRPQSRAQVQHEHQPAMDDTQSPSSAYHSQRSHSRDTSENSSNETAATSLPALQSKGPPDEHDQLEPLAEEDLDPGSFDLVAPPDSETKQYSLETRSEQLFSTEHLRVIFADPSLLLRFTGWMSACRETSIPILIYYLDAIKAIKAIHYSNAIAEALDPLPGYDFTTQPVKNTFNLMLEERAKQAFDVLVREDLPAYITHTYIQTVSLSIQRRITGTLPSHLREASEGLAEVFCLTDPSRPDSPIVFASEEFHRTTQYGMSYVLGRNCRFLQGPKTNPFSVRRIREKIEAGEEHCEVFLNYRRDGSPFMNLLMCAPLCDSRGKIRYFIGAQVDVSGLVKECSDLESLKRVAVAAEHKASRSLEEQSIDEPKKDEFQELSEMLNMQELDTVRKWGGRMHKEAEDEFVEGDGQKSNWHKPRLLLSDASPDCTRTFNFGRPSGRLSGVYENYLLVRPYPSLRVLFASPSLRVPGILQSPFMAKIGGSNRVRDELTQALADGRGVTAKVRWVTKQDIEGRNRWIHCTPLIGSNGAIGVWMIVIVDDENSQPPARRFKQAPPVDPRFGRNIRAGTPFGDSASTRGDGGSLRSFAYQNGAEPSLRGFNDFSDNDAPTDGRESPYSLRISDM